jgi:hypothetical protein
MRKAGANRAGVAQVAQRLFTLVASGDIRSQLKAWALADVHSRHGCGLFGLWLQCRLHTHMGCAFAFALMLRLLAFDALWGDWLRIVQFTHAVGLG